MTFHGIRPRWPSYISPGHRVPPPHTSHQTTPTAYTRIVEEHVLRLYARLSRRHHLPRLSLRPTIILNAQHAPISQRPNPAKLTTSPSEASRLGLSHQSSLQQPLTKLRIPPLSMRHNPVAATSATSQTDSSPAPQTPESAAPIAPSPTRSFKDLKACLQRPAEESKGKEDTWQDAMRGGFLTFSSNL